MASLSLSAPFKPSIFPPPAASKTLKSQSLLCKLTTPGVRAIVSVSHGETRPSNLGLGLGSGTEESPYSLTFSPSSSAPPAAARGAADSSDVMGMLLRERIVFLGSQIDDFVADAIISQLLLLDAIDSTKDIRLFINSPGGSLSATMAIFDVVQLIRADVSTIGLGIAASTSSIILGGGTKGKRLAMPNTRIMLHQPLGGASGQAIDVEIQAKEIMHNKTNVTRLISGFTGRSFEQVQKDIDRDRYMSPIEAVEYGIIDGVIDQDSIIPLMPVPDKVKPKLNYEEINKDPRKFLTPEIPDDEIY
ncbi:ATP-dependent Clp protease proteolytic subunit 4, chloroplastic [Iris pallida]|uniref:ATP-dependent Clp protease proteolytic subunit n=1 Tax=Iris pallida TaxID=29817 RepID=A0AAX6HZB4_IRIPA|nr:ATP-dependent Clp protease proteolytic subunit 4, chloroplastic [Iris pallida]